MRTLISAIGFCELTGRSLHVCWPTTPKWQTWPLRDWRHWTKWRRWPAEHRFEADLTDLWEAPCEVVSVERWNEMIHSTQSRECPLPPCPDWNEQVIYLETCHDFYKILPLDPSIYASRLRPVTSILKRVAATGGKMISGAGGPVVGVHIRTNAKHTETQANSPMEWFINRMRELKELIPGVAFFLVADSDRVSVELQRAGVGPLFEQCRPRGYNTRHGIEKALADVYLLAKTDYILGSYFSSFSYMAAMLQAVKAYEDSHYQWGTLPGSQPGPDVT